MSIAERLRDRTTLRYMGNCKCGKCQLVPHSLVGEAANAIDGLHKLADERFDELKRAQAIIDGLKDYRESLLTCPLEIEPAGRRRIRDLCTPPKDDHDRAVLLLLDDMERLIKFIARPAGPSLGVDPPAEA